MAANAPLLSETDRRILSVVFSFVSYVRREIKDLDTPQPQIAIAIASAWTALRLTLAREGMTASELDEIEYGGGKVPRENGSS